MYLDKMPEAYKVVIYFHVRPFSASNNFSSLGTLITHNIELERFSERKSKNKQIVIVALDQKSRRRVPKPI